MAYAFNDNKSRARIVTYTGTRQVQAKVFDNVGVSFSRLGIAGVDADKVHILSVSQKRTQSGEVWFENGSITMDTGVFKGECYPRATVVKGDSPRIAIYVGNASTNTETIPYRVVAMVVN